MAGISFEDFCRQLDELKGNIQMSAASSHWLEKVLIRIQHTRPVSNGD
jgi:hypothetical protein